MTSPLGKLLVVLGLDSREFDSGIGRAQKSITGFGQAGDMALRAGAAAIGTGLAFAAKGAMELEDRMATFQAETGASAEEAQHFRDSLNDMAGHSLVSMDNIAQAMTAIRTDLGLTGAQADAAAADFERFMRATGQGSDAVLAFDDILDAWNLDATAAASIMDVLVKSHQEYGGSIAENQATLAALAPALQAANMSWEDGQALLNLFAASGVDATAMVTGMQKALGTVESPQELQQLLDDISSTEDAFERAQKAGELFGTRAGAKIGDALANAEGDFDSFRVTATDALGAVDDAAGALDGTLSSQVKLAVNHAASILRGFGSDVGPILMAGMAATSIATTFGLDKLLGKLWGRAAGTAVVQGAIAAAGAAASVIYRGAAFVADLFISAAQAVWVAVAAPASATMVAARAAGMGMGAAVLAGAMAALGPLAVVVTAALAAAETTKDMGTKGSNDARSYISAFSDEMQKPYPDNPRNVFRFPWEEGGLFNPRKEIYDPLSSAIVDGYDRLGGVIETASAELGRQAGMGTMDIGDDLVGGIRESFKLATAEVAKGFGAIKDALKNKPMLISDAQREENMQARLRQIMRNMREAAEANDSKTVKHWEAARAKQQAALDRLKGKTHISMADIKGAYEKAGISVQGTWADTTFVVTQESKKASDAAIAQMQRAQTTIASINMVQTGTDLMTSLGIGLENAAPAVYAAADRIAAEVARRLREGNKPPPIDPPDHRPKVPAADGPAMGYASGTTTFNIGNLYGGPKGLDELDREVGRRRNLRSRGALRYRDTN